MMRLRPAFITLLLAGTALATRPWTPAELRAWERDYRPAPLTRPDLLPEGPRRYNYLERIRMMADFVARHQVADSGSPHFGGIREAEHQPEIIETDNTQEAIWVWSRWYELTGRDDYRENLRRAWHYVLNFPAYREHSGDPSSLWYAVWNCGLAFMAESRYRAAYADTSFRAYADSCRGFFLRNPLGTGYLDWFVTAQSAGMAYAWAVENGNEVLRDSALARGTRVKDWLEDDAAGRLGWAQWAMCGGTAFWGVANTVGLEDTAAGRRWVETYAESLPGFHPTGNWNCSHNIWLANAWRAAAELGGNEQQWRIHQYLLDTLLALDTDRDGGIPATWTDPDTRDQTWVSTYLHFMAMDVYTTPTHERDAAQLEFANPRPGRLLIAPDSAEVLVPLANVGLRDLVAVEMKVTGADYQSGLTVPSLPFLAIDTLTFPRLAVPVPGRYSLEAVTTAPGDEDPANDTSRVEFKVYGLRTVAGRLTDSVTGAGVTARLYARVAGDPAAWDSCETDPAGAFSLRVIDTTVVISARPRAPYYDRDWQVMITGDTTVELVTSTAHLLLVNNDPAAAYQRYYTDALDALGVTWTAWSRPDSGSPPWRVIPALRSPTVIYYSGDADAGTIPAEDRDSLSARAGAGINLLLSGQDLAEELAGTPFLADLCGVQYDSTGWARFFAFGNRADSLGRDIHAFATAGGDGAGNQRSRDMLSPLRNGAATLLVYDTISELGAGIRRTDHATGSRVITLGFGFEAVNRPSSRPDFLDRPGLLARLLSWFEIPTGIAGPEPPRVRAAALRAWPNPFRRAVRLAADLPPGTRLVVCDAAGRVVDRLVLAPGDGTSCATWASRSHPAGVYFVAPDRAPAPALRVVRLP
ncbi:MAG: hypothetical protein R6X14_07525 [bacterium]